MDKELDQRRREEMARRADELLTNPAMAAAFKIMRESCYNTIVTSKAEEADKREDAYYFARCVDVFETALNKLIRDGQEVNKPVFELPGLRRD